MKSLTLILTMTMLLLATAETKGADFSIRPSITLSEEYNDNIFLVEKDKKDDFITRVRPSISMQYEMPRWKLDMDGAVDYRYYADVDVDDDLTYAIDAFTQFELLNEFFFLDLRDEYTRVSLDVTRDFTQESIFFNQSDRNTFSVDPHVVIRPLLMMEVTAGYMFSDIWFREDEGIDRTVQSVYADVVYEAQPQLTFYAGYRYTKEDSDTSDYTKNDASIGVRYEYGENSHIFFTLGNSWLDFENHKSDSRIFWDASIIQQIWSVTTTVAAAVDYIQDPDGELEREDRYSISLRRVFDRADFGIALSYREFRDAVQREIETSTYGVRADFTYPLTSKSSMILDGIVEKVEDKLDNTDTWRYLPGFSFHYNVAENTILTVQYRYGKSDSSEVGEDIYTSNRFIIEIRKEF